MSRAPPSSVAVSVRILEPNLVLNRLVERYRRVDVRHVERDMRLHDVHRCGPTSIVLPKSKYRTRGESRWLAALALAALAAVLPEVVGKGSKGREDCAVVDIRSLTSRLEQPGSRQSVDVVT